MLIDCRRPLIVHDIFKPQPVRDAAVFFLRAISHDWSDDYCVKFLSHLRAAATPNTQLIVIDNVIPYACADSGSGPALDIPGASNIRPTAPPPLLPNFGAGGIMTYLADIAVSAIQRPAVCDGLLLITMADCYCRCWSG